MSNWTEIVRLILQLPEEQRAAITGLIDIQTEEQMNKLMARIDRLEAKMEARLQAIEAIQGIKRSH